MMRVYYEGVTETLVDPDASLYFRLSARCQQGVECLFSLPPGVVRHNRRARVPACAWTVLVRVVRGRCPALDSSSSIRLSGEKQLPSVRQTYI